MVQHADPVRSAGRTWLPVTPFTPFAGGLVAALTLVAMYLGIIGAAESFRHALDQLRTDAIWVTLVALGFGAQIGLYIQIRQLLRTAAPSATRTLTGAGTGTSTAGMIACCAHHLADIAPFIGLAGATAFLSRYRLVFILVGLAINGIGILISLRTLRKVTKHLSEAARAPDHAQTPSCH